MAGRETDPRPIKGENLNAVTLSQGLVRMDQQPRPREPVEEEDRHPVRMAISGQADGPTVLQVDQLTIVHARGHHIWQLNAHPAKLHRAAAGGHFPALRAPMVPFSPEPYSPKRQTAFVYAVLKPALARFRWLWLSHMATTDAREQPAAAASCSRRSISAV